MHKRLDDSILFGKESAESRLVYQIVGELFVGKKPKRELPGIGDQFQGLLNRQVGLPDDVHDQSHYYLQASYLPILFPDLVLTRHSHPSKSARAFNNLFLSFAAYYKLQGAGGLQIRRSRRIAAPNANANDVQYSAHRASR